MTKEQALNYLKSSGFSKEQIQAIVKALSSSNNLSSGTRKNSKKLEKGNDLVVDCNNCKNNCYRGDGTSYCATGDGMCHYECEETTKNDLGVECISRAEVLKIFDEWFATCDIADRKASPKMKIKALPSVTPIRPKGHWIKIGDRGFGYSDIVICKCSECEYQTEFVGKFDRHNLVIDAEHADNYCSNCGADMRGEECQKKKQ